MLPEQVSARSHQADVSSELQVPRRSRMQTEDQLGLRHVPDVFRACPCSCSLPDQHGAHIPDAQVLQVAKGSQSYQSSPRPRHSSIHRPRLQVQDLARAASHHRALQTEELTDQGTQQHPNIKVVRPRNSTYQRQHPIIKAARPRKSPAQEKDPAMEAIRPHTESNQE